MPVFQSTDAESLSGGGGLRPNLVFSPPATIVYANEADDPGCSDNIETCGDPGQLPCCDSISITVYGEARWSEAFTDPVDDVLDDDGPFFILTRSHDRIPPRTGGNGWDYPDCDLEEEERIKAEAEKNCRASPSCSKVHYIYDRNGCLVIAMLIGRDVPTYTPAPYCPKGATCA